MHSVLEIVVVRPLGSTQSLVGRCVRVKVHATTALKEIHVFENEIDSCLSNHEELDNYWKFYTEAKRNRKILRVKLSN